MQGISTVNYFKYLKPCKNINIHLKTHASSVQLFNEYNVLYFPKESVSRSLTSHLTSVM